MANWRWIGVDKEGQRVSGIEDVQDRTELRRLLRGKGIRPLKLKPPSIFETDISQWLVEKGFARPFTNQELLQFTQQLAVMTNAGIPILQALEILYKQQKNISLKVSIRRMTNDIGSGKTLSETLAEQRGFTKIYCNLVRAGESGGVLDQILEKLVTYIQKAEKIKSQIKSALTYPSIVVTVGTGVIYLMLVFVVPKFTEMLVESGQEIPAVTQFVIDASDWLQNYSLLVILITIVTLTSLSAYFKTPQGRPIWDQFTMQIPIFGNIVIKGNLAHFTRTLSTMIGSGVSLTDSLDICMDTVENGVIAKDIKRVKEGIETAGKTFAEMVAKISYFPEMVSQMIKVGEQTGNLDMMLDKISDLFEKDVEETIGIATKLIEPIILVGLGGVVGLILIAMYLPIFMSAGAA